MWGVNGLRRLFMRFSAGVADRAASYVTGRKISVGKAIIRKLAECDPWKSHIYESAIKGIAHALHDKDFISARALLAMGTK